MARFLTFNQVKYVLRDVIESYQRLVNERNLYDGTPKPDWGEWDPNISVVEPDNPFAIIAWEKAEDRGNTAILGDEDEDMVCILTSGDAMVKVHADYSRGSLQKLIRKSLPFPDVRKLKLDRLGYYLDSRNRVKLFERHQDTLGVSTLGDFLHQVSRSKSIDYSNWLQIRDEESIFLVDSQTKLVIAQIILRPDHRRDMKKARPLFEKMTWEEFNWPWVRTIVKIHRRMQKEAQSNKKDKNA